MSDHHQDHPAASTSTGATEALSFTLSEKSGLLVVAFAGSLARDAVTQLEEVQRKLGEFNARWIVFHFKDVSSSCDRNVVPILTRLQKAARDSRARIRVSALSPALKKFLTAQGVVRVDELATDLFGAVRDLLNEKGTTTPQAA